MKLAAPVRKAILSGLSERDEAASICRDADGVPASVREFFAREVLPHVPDVWIDTTKRDHRDDLVGLVGFEINFNRYFLMDRALWRTSSRTSGRSRATSK